ncbi:MULTISPECIES: DinB family protein [unclassified Flavobacterium]|uniref:DinB family protein n=1 Tax=unclassified Flavobacterium TaxID=196869 RepID=UPI000EB1CBBD|nr:MULTISPECIES: DinB family protein [unclassified Flavobacterium]
MNKSEIITNLMDYHAKFWETAIQLPNPTIGIKGKWSVYQNVDHINISIMRLGNYLALPKSQIETLCGLSERRSTTYEKLVKIYLNAMSSGVKATDAFIPELNLNGDIKELINHGKNLLEIFISNLNDWTEEELDLYHCPHPALGTITVRETLYFTIYHVQHHEKIIMNHYLKN